MTMTRREPPLDAAVILRALADHDVDYVVVGGMAVQAHGNPRTTQALDLVPEPSRANGRRLVQALTDLGARPLGELDPTPVVVPRSGVLELDTDAGGVDIHRSPPGAAPYPDLRRRALELELEPGVTVPVAGLDDLIAMKRASGRPIDRSDILALTEP
jgi:hypothetical protein